MKNILYTLLTIISVQFVNAQSNMYITGELEGGILTTNYNIPSTVDNSLIDEENSNFNLKASVSFLMEWENNVSAEAGLGQSLRYWTLEGKGNHENEFKLKHRQSFPSLFVGGFYQVPITSGNVDLNIYGGSKISVDFVNYNALNKQKGVDRDYVVASTKEAEKISLNAIPEIGIKGYFESGNFWQLGVKYNIPLNGDIIEGKMMHFMNGNPTPIETTTFSSNGSYFAVAFKYGFKLRK